MAIFFSSVFQLAALLLFYQWTFHSGSLNNLKERAAFVIISANG